MKAVSEFAGHILTKGIAAKTALTAEGKSEEEITTSLGETFKFKDNRLKYYMAALGVAEANQEKLYRVRAFTYEEGETVPEIAVQVEEIYYVPEFFTGPKPAKPVATKQEGRGGGGKKDRPKGPKPSPWGMSPEEMAEKKKASQKAAEKAKK